MLREAGTSLDLVVKATAFVTDLGDFGKLNAIYAQRFGAHKPARSTVQIAALPRGTWGKTPGNDLCIVSSCSRISLNLNS